MSPKPHPDVSVDPLNEKGKQIETYIDMAVGLTTEHEQNARYASQDRFDAMGRTE